MCTRHEDISFVTKTSLSFVTKTSLSFFISPRGRLSFSSPLPPLPPTSAHFPVSSHRLTQVRMHTGLVTKTVTEIRKGENQYRPSLEERITLPSRSTIHQTKRRGERIWTRHRERHPTKSQKERWNGTRNRVSPMSDDMPKPPNPSIPKRLSALEEHQTQ